ncbi:MAG: ComEC/Rec2 family competence protein [Oscillospiraceae bacterium]
MKRKISKKLTAILLIPVSFVVLLSFTTEGRQMWDFLSHLTHTANRDSIADKYDFNLHFLDVGKADSILIESRGKFILIDGGDINSTDYILTYLHRRKVRELEAVFLSHPDSDHLGAFATVLRKFPTKEFYTTKGSAQTPEYLDMINVLQEKNVPISYLRAGNTLEFGKINFAFFSPEGTYANSNDNSLVFRVYYEDFSTLFTGDAGLAAEKNILKSDMHLQSDVLKISHHGSDTASCEDFLTAVNPKLAVISVGQDRNFLPNLQVMNRLKNMNIPTYRTDTQGTLIVSYNHLGNINISTKEEEYEITNRRSL